MRNRSQNRRLRFFLSLLSQELWKKVFQSDLFSWGNKTKAQRKKLRNYFCVQIFENIDNSHYRLHAQCNWRQASLVRCEQKRRYNHLCCEKIELCRFLLVFQAQISTDGHSCSGMSIAFLTWVCEHCFRLRLNPPLILQLFVPHQYYVLECLQDNVSWTNAFCSQ